MESTASTLAVHHKMYSITIPAAADAFANLGVLLEAAGYDKHHLHSLGGMVLPVAADYRAATVVGGSPSYTVPAGDSYSQPVTEFAEDTWARASAGAAITAIFVVYWKS